MLGILLLILKIIGWLFAGVAGLALFLLLLVLFVPVPYRVRAAYEETLAVQVRIFGVRIFPREKKAKKQKKARPENKKNSSVENLPHENSADKNLADKNSAIEKQLAESSPDKGRSGEKQKKQPENQDEKQNRNQMKKREKKRKKKREAEARGERFDLRGKWSILRGEFADEGNRRALARLLAELRYLVRHSGPRRVEADVVFSLGDPANTGYATAALALCPFAYGKRCSIIPDFEADTLYLKGQADARGHVRMVHFLRSGLRLLVDKDIRAVIRKVKNNF